MPGFAPRLHRSSPRKVQGLCLSSFPGIHSVHPDPTPHSQPLCIDVFPGETAGDLIPIASEMSTNQFQPAEIRFLLPEDHAPFEEIRYHIYLARTDIFGKQRLRYSTIPAPGFPIWSPIRASNMWTLPTPPTPTAGTWTESDKKAVSKQPQNCGAGKEEWLPFCASANRWPNEGKYHSSSPSQRC